MIFTPEFCILSEVLPIISVERLSNEWFLRRCSTKGDSFRTVKIPILDSNLVSNRQKTNVLGLQDIEWLKILPEEGLKEAKRQRYWWV